MGGKKGTGREGEDGLCRIAGTSSTTLSSEMPCVYAAQFERRPSPPKTLENLRKKGKSVEEEKE